MKYGSICSGIEAATVAWHPLGWKPVFFAEIEKFPLSVLKHHYPKVPNAGDFTRIQQGYYDPIELLVGGTPCQDFSVAGLRAGVAGERGNLTFEFLRLLDRLRPRWVVWENVPGLLSSTSHRSPDPCPPPDPMDLESEQEEVVLEDEYDASESHALNSFVAGLSELGYGWAMRVLDAQHFGVPQRRRRVFVVGHLGDWRRAAAVLFERHSLSGYPPPRREARQGVAGGVEIGPAGGRLTDVTPTLDARCKDGFIRNQIGAGVITGTLTSRVDAGHPERHTRQRTERAGYLDQGSQHAVAIGWSEELTASVELAGTIQRGGEGGRHEGVMTPTMAVRRLTPRECERLQGFPDDYTKVSDKTADGPRYKALGNSMAVPVMRWIGERIQMVESIE